jgi:N-methylhydantoinase A
MQRCQIGIDVGGTFTDVVVAGPERPLYLKVPTHSRAQAESAREGLECAADRLGLELSDLLARTDRIVHGTTIATNMMIEGTGSRVGLLTTAGFRDELEYRRGLKEAIYDPTLPPPRPLVRRRDRVTVAERIGADGSVVAPLPEEDVRTRIRELRDSGCQALAIGFLFSFLEPAHERRAREIAEEEWPEVYLSVSSEVLPQVREYERFSTTAVNAYVGPGTARYLERLESDLRRAGFRGEFLVILSSGGVIDGQFAGRRAASLLLSGPAGGVLAATELLARRTRHRDLITIDMGGTSYDVCLVADARPTVTASTFVERHAVALPMFGIHTIGAGGGSVARVDRGGVLRVGPESAGATPGPACYGRGGLEPTVTDANLVLGYLNPEATFGGSIKLDAERARSAIRNRIAEPLALSLEAAAFGILRMINAHMTGGIRVVSVQQGHDPRDFSLVAFGGNGAVHAGRQAEELEIGTVLVPRMAGALSAWGALHADARVDHLATWVGRCDTADEVALGRVFVDLRAKGAQTLSDIDVVHEGFLACHYAGQTAEIWVPVEVSGDAVSRAALAEVAQRFHGAHEREHSFAKGDEAVHIIGVKVTSRRSRDGAGAIVDEVSESAVGTPSPECSRPVWFDSDSGWTPTPIYGGKTLEPGVRIDGPAIVEEPDTTIVVYPGWRCRLDGSQIYHLTREGGVA